ncbi:MAG: hypothetical protein HY747_05300 [Elusimicrobia bacterium]|nr:hypothetical protein [Elusimicrobiota bacterium]
MPAKPSMSRSKKSKAEVQEEFDKIKEQLDQDKSELNPKTEELARQRQVEVKEAVKEVTPEGVVQKISSLGVEVTKTLSELSSKLVGETDLLTTLREAVSLEHKELERLHKIDITATAIDQLVEEYGQKKQALETEISQTRAQWIQEQEEREKEQKEYEENLKKQRQREKEEYDYQRNNARLKEHDAYEESVRLQERKNKEKQEILEKSWQGREAALKEKEEEFNRLKKEAADFPQQIKKERDLAMAEATKALEAKHAQQTLMLQKDAQAEGRLSELKIKSLEETAARQLSQIESLGQRLEEAKKQVQDIAVKAIEGASGAKALSHVSQLAMEQAKLRTGQS